MFKYIFTFAKAAWVLFCLRIVYASVPFFLIYFLNVCVCVSKFFPIQHFVCCRHQEFLPLYRNRRHLPHTRSIFCSGEKHRTPSQAPTIRSLDYVTFKLYLRSSKQVILQLPNRLDFYLLKYTSWHFQFNTHRAFITLEIGIHAGWSIKSTVFQIHTKRSDIAMGIKN